MSRKIYKRRRYGIRNRRSWTDAESAYIWARDEGHCVYCGAVAQQIDHVVPVAKGGPTIRANGVLACSPCNHAKFAKLPLAMLIRAFFHLLIKGEDLDWLDSLWAQSKLDLIQEDRAVYVVEPIIEGSVS